MENKPTEEVVVAENTTPEAVDTTSDSSSKEVEDLTTLIEAEKQRGKPDPEKAKQRFLKKHQPETEDDEDDSDDDDDDKPLTRSELVRILGEHQREQTLVTHESTIAEISSSLADTAQEAELIREIHKNRVFPAGMPIREQLEEAHAIASIKRVEARNAELTRKIQSQQTVSRNTATTHRDPQAPLEPEMAPDLKASMVRAGYTFNATNKRFEKKLPNGKILVKENGKQPYLVG